MGKRKQRTLYVWGICHPEQGDPENILELPPGDVLHSAETSVGISFRDQHGEAFGDAGFIKHSWMEPEKKAQHFIAEMPPNPNSVQRGIMEQNLRAGLLKEASMTANTYIAPRGKGYLAGTPTEISVVPEGQALRGRGCAVLAVFERAKYGTDGIHLIGGKYINQVAEPTPTAQASTSQTTAPHHTTTASTNTIPLPLIQNLERAFSKMADATASVPADGVDKKITDLQAAIEEMKKKQAELDKAKQDHDKELATTVNKAKEVGSTAPPAEEKKPETTDQKLEQMQKLLEQNMKELAELKKPAETPTKETPAPTTTTAPATQPAASTPTQTAAPNAEDVKKLSEALMQSMQQFKLQQEQLEKEKQGRVELEKKIAERDNLKREKKEAEERTKQNEFRTKMGAIRDNFKELYSEYLPGEAGKTFSNMLDVAVDTPDQLKKEQQEYLRNTVEAVTKCSAQTKAAVERYRQEAERLEAQRASEASKMALNAFDELRNIGIQSKVDFPGDTLKRSAPESTPAPTSTDGAVAGLVPPMSLSNPSVEQPPAKRQRAETEGTVANDIIQLKSGSIPGFIQDKLGAPVSRNLGGAKERAPDLYKFLEGYRSSGEVFGLPINHMKEGNRITEEGFPEDIRLYDLRNWR